MRILCFANDSPERWWRLDMPKKWIERNTDWRIDIVDLSRWTSGLEGYDLIIGRSFISEKVVDTIHSWGVKILYEIDGAEPLLSDEHFANLKTAYGRDAHKHLMGTMQKCDAVLVSTLPLAEWIGSFVRRPIVLFPNYMDLEWWNNHACERRVSGGAEIRLGWFGMRSHVFDIQNILVPIIEKLRLIYPCAFYIPESVVHIIPSHLRSHIHAVPQWKMHERPSLARKYMIDIMLVPLEPTGFNACKSAIKYYENGADEIPGIYSPTVYSSYVRHGKTGYIADTLDEWMCALNSLSSKKIRKNIGKRAYQDVRANYNATNRYQEWVNAIQSVYEQS